MAADRYVIVMQLLLDLVDRKARLGIPTQAEKYETECQRE